MLRWFSRLFFMVAELIFYKITCSLQGKILYALQEPHQSTLHHVLSLALQVGDSLSSFSFFLSLSLSLSHVSVSVFLALANNNLALVICLTFLNQLQDNGAAARCACKQNATSQRLRICTPLIHPSPPLPQPHLINCYA